VIGVPLYGKADYLPAAIDSLLAQTHRACALVLVDDCSPDETPALARAYAQAHAHVSFFANPERLGLVGNWRRCFELARELHPGARYFAWGSDHDVWDSEWLARLAGELDAHPEAVLAYSRNQRLLEAGGTWHGSRDCQTAGMRDPLGRVGFTVTNMTAGSMVYGLMRADALKRAGVLRHVLAPDRLVLAELAIQGESRQVPELLWHRRFTNTATVARQRRSIFPGDAPWHARVNSLMVHTAILLWRYGALGAGRPQLGRLRGAAAALLMAYSRVRAKGGKRLGKWWRVRSHRTRRARKRLRRGAARAVKRARRGPRRALRVVRRAPSVVRRDGAGASPDAQEAPEAPSSERSDSRSIRSP